MALCGLAAFPKLADDGEALASALIAAAAAADGVDPVEPVVFTESGLEVFSSSDSPTSVGLVQVPGSGVLSVAVVMTDPATDGQVAVLQTLATAMGLDVDAIVDVASTNGTVNLTEQFIACVTPGVEVLVTSTATGC
jgi:hypothetical protein